MPTYAVGDIQGCLAPLLELLDFVEFNPKKDTLWIAGDLINRGPDSLESLRFAKSLGKSVVMVLGNHDLHLLAHINGHRALSKKDTLQEIIDAPDCEKLANWLKKHPLVHHDKQLGFTMVHAGIPPIWNIKQALEYSAEVEQKIQSASCGEYYAEMYGNEPECWDDNLTGMSRLRVITNYFTRMRFCDEDGRLELLTKTGPELPPEGYAPWYQHKNHKCKKDNIVFGHWAALQGDTGKKNYIGLDTGCVWGGHLTMMRLEDREFFNIGCAAQE